MCGRKSMRLRFLSTIIIVLTVSMLSAQRDTLGRYSPGFKFKDGLYMSFEDFKQNCPSIRQSEIVSEEKSTYEEIDPRDEWFQLVNDSLRLIEKDSVWGYSNRGKVFLRNQEYFDRLVVIGSLCHIIHRETFMDYNSAMYNGFGYVPIQREVQVEFFLDMRTGEKEKFIERNFEKHLADDPVLFASFSKMSKKRKKESMFQFLHAYNQDHPVYFPISRCRK